MLNLRPEVAEALQRGLPVVALESTLIAHGLPWPINLETAKEAEAVVRAEGAVPATIAVWQGRPTIGLTPAEIEQLARSVRPEEHLLTVRKASRRDLASAMVAGATAATTVAATMYLAHRVGIRLFATGGIGGVHPALPGEVTAFDVSADLFELARIPVAVVCAGAKSILDLSATLEVLETYSVPVVGYGTDEFPAFYVRNSGLPVSMQLDTPAEAARFLQTHWSLEGAGVVLCQPLPADQALGSGDLTSALAAAEQEAARRGVRGPARTPFLLAQLAERTGGRALQVNQTLIIANARLAARIARALLDKSMRILAIGDIHGALTALNAVLARVEPQPEDLLVTLGDYVDRGPDSRGVLDRLIDLNAHGCAGTVPGLIALRGNHDVMMVEARDGLERSMWLACGGRQTLKSYGIHNENGDYSKIPESHWCFLEIDCRDYYETDTHFFVHANVCPDVPLADQPTEMLYWEKLFPFEAKPHMSGKVMVCGHTKQWGNVPLSLGHTICIDTGVYETNGWLTCLDVLTGEYWQANQRGEVRGGWLEEAGYL